MKILAIVSQKGGAGKTTLAANLAVAGQLAGEKVVMFDLDPQHSLAGWANGRSAAPAARIIDQATKLMQGLEVARREGFTIAVIDTPPAVDSVAAFSADASDLIVIPCRPAILDMRALAPTVRIVRDRAKPAAIVLNACRPSGSSSDEAVAGLSVYKVPIAPVRLTYRAAFQDAATASQGVQEFEPKGRAAGEVGALWQWIIAQL